MPAFSTTYSTPPSSAYAPTPKFSGSGTALTKTIAPSPQSSSDGRCANSKTLSPRITTSRSSPANCRAIPTPCAIPPPPPAALRDPPRLRLHLVGQVELEQHVPAAAGPHAPVAEQVDELPGVR